MIFVNNKQIRDFFFLLVGVSLFLGILLKAINFTITNDEAYSFALVMTNYIKALVGTANTHWVNSFFMKLQSVLFGYSPWILRLHVLVSFVFYLLASRVISINFFSGVFSYITFIVLTVNPYLNDFFSIARGYGPALCFMLWGIIYFIKYIKNDNPKTLLSGWILSSLAVISNYTVLYFYIASCLFFTFWFYKNKINRISIKEHLFSMLIISGTLIFSISNLLFIKFYTGDLETGGEISLASDTLGSIVLNSLYGLAFNEWYIVGIVLLFIVFIFFTLSILDLYNKKEINLLLFTSVIAGLILLLILVFHFLFHTPFNSGRTSIFLYPVISLVLGSGIFKIYSHTVYKRAISIILVLPVVFMAFWGIKNAYTSYCFDVKDQAGADKVLLYIQNVYGNDKSLQIALPQWYYGIQTNYYKTIWPQENKFSTFLFRKEDILAASYKLGPSDIIVVCPASDTSVLNNNDFKYEIVKYFQQSNAIILKRQSKVPG